MNIDLVFIDHTRSKPRLLSRGLALRVVEKTLSHLRVRKGSIVEVAVVVVGERRMQELNAKWRKIDKSTDVLAFPLPGPRVRGYTSISLGDIFICPVIVRKKAARSGLSESAQMKWTLVHGLLHLGGHDHERSAAAAKKMAVLERKVLKNLK